METDNDTQTHELRNRDSAASSSLLINSCYQPRVLLSASHTSSFILYALLRPIIVTSTTVISDSVSTLVCGYTTILCQPCA